ncbi:MAG: hypothetical protein J0L51_10835 [Rhizobiales bacterium]|nr:hypothetical protein [Hyphomicrobiales bacterium]
MLARWIFALGLLGLAFAANATLLLREPSKPQAPSGTAEIDLSGLPLKVSRALILDPAQRGGGRLLRLDLALDRRTFEPLPPPSLTQDGASTPQKLHLVLTNPGLQAPPADQLQQLYARFLLAETQNTPTGLMLRRFRPGTPYEDRELFIGAGQFGGGLGRLFIALCPKSGILDIEPCTAKLRHEGVDIELRFPAQALSDWRRIATEAFRIVGEMRSSEPG